MQVVLTLPKAHVRVLDTEAAMLGLRRYQFVELLFLSELGQAILTRPSYMQSYQFVLREIDETQRVLIYFRPEVKKLFEEHLARQRQRPSSWVAMALRNWAHLDDALRAVKYTLLWMLRVACRQPAHGPMRTTNLGRPEPSPTVTPTS